MTAVNWWLQPNGILVVSDTLLGYSRNDEPGRAMRPAAFVQKVFPLSHYDALISGRGDGDLIAAWTSLAATRLLARDFDMLADLAPQLIRDLVDECDERRGCPFDGTTSIFMWGWSPVADRVVGFAYRSGDGFVQDGMADGVRFAPMVESLRVEVDQAVSARDTNIPALLASALRHQHADARKAPDTPQRNIVGGDAMVTSLTVGEDGGIDISCRRLYRFDDHEADYQAAWAALPS